MKPITKLHEFVAAVHSPFHADGSLAPAVVPTQAAFLKANGVKTVFVTGSTGECHSLTCDERLTLYEAWADAGETHGMSVIGHVGSNSLEDARSLARRARALRLSAISALAPSYYKPGTVADLVEWCAAIAAEAPELPFYYYDIPVMTGVSLPIEQFLVDASPRIPNLAGVKFTNPDLVSYRRCVDIDGGRFDLPWGIDEALLGALATGARGGVGSTYNWAPQLYTELMQAFQAGEIETARRRQSVSIAMVDAIASTGFMGTAKALMTRLGVPVGPARQPHGNPRDDQIDTLVTTLAKLGFETWGAK